MADEIPEAATEAVIDVLLRRWETIPAEYGVNRDVFADAAREVLAAAMPHLDDAGDPLDDVYRWLVGVLGYPIDMRTEQKPRWLDVRRLAAEWQRHEHQEGTPVDAWVDMIHEETGWPEAADGRVIEGDS